MIMKRTFAIAAMAALGILICLSGCSTTAPKAAAPKGDLQFTEQIDAVVTADQKIVMDGKKFSVPEVPAQLAKRNASKYITIVVMPESKMTRETLVELIQTLVKNKYFVAIGDNSKYADVPVPRS